VNKKSNGEIEKISSILKIEKKFCVSIIQQTGLTPAAVIKAIEESDFTKEEISRFFDMVNTGSFNSFLFLITKLKTSVTNMKKVIYYFASCNMLKEILTIYCGVANLINEDKAMLLPILRPLMRRFDKKMGASIDCKNPENMNILKFYNNTIINLLRFKADKMLFDEKINGIDYKKKVLNLAYMRLFLEIAEASKEEYYILSYDELEIISSSQTSEYIPVFEDFELYDKLIFDRIVDLVLNYNQYNKFEISELMEYFLPRDVIVKLYYNKEKEEENSVNKKIESSACVQPEIENTNISYIELSSLIKDKIIGQDNAVNKIIQRLKTADYNVLKESGAKAVFLLMGPTGVGKTEIVKIISNNLKINNKEKLIRIDMSEYKEPHAVSKILGAPPGYIGYNSDEKNNVFDKVKENPNAIILLDEIEKAHPAILDIFLHIFDEGKAKNNKQEIVDFSNNIIFMTSNIGVKEANKNKMGFNNQNTNDKLDEDVKTYKKELENYARLEFINRIDEIVIFNKLNKDQIKTIINNQVANMIKRIKDKKQIDIKLELSDPSLEYLVSKMDFDKFGAREVRRVIETTILNELINYSIENSLKECTLNMDYNNGIKFNYQKVIKQ
jgi:ATP-dependent Clp protease ATP-binding subunit ClpA